MADIVNVRSATAADAAVVARLQQDMARELGTAGEPGFVDRFAKTWLADLERRPTWLAERDGRAIGVLILVVIDKLPWPGQAPGRWAHVSLVFVDQADRNAGVGHLLLGEMLAWAAANRVDRVQLNANPNSARLYRKAGFDSAPARLMELRI
ncbi:GNAT family N-acetyltransferase [Kitasatospora sp. NPDC052896]|uniref:GNAT family N-acetyltransferase n=1 Tax=Kitasatospora sp. NPDC052896 TaxID=3364061 RepID=UPI0037CABB70